MQTTGRPVRRSLSLLLSVLMVITALPLVSFPAHAAPTPADYTALNAALNAITTMGTISQQHGNAYDSTDRTGAGDYPALSSGGSWVKSTGGQAVWDALELYGNVVANLYADPSTHRDEGFASLPGNSIAYNNASNDSDYSQRASIRQIDITSGRFVQGMNDNARRLAQSVAGQTGVTLNTNTTTGELDSGSGVKGDALKYFAGNFRFVTPLPGPGGAGNTARPSLSGSHADSAIYDLLDLPRVMYYTYSIAAYGDNQVGSDGKYVNGWKQSPGGFAVLRSALDAIKEYGNDINDFANSMGFITAKEIYYHHAARQTERWKWGSWNLAGTGTVYQQRFSWHVLDEAPEVREGTVVTNPLVGTNEKTSMQLNTVPMKAWQRLDWDAPLASMSYGDLYALRTAYDKAYADMNAVTFASDIGRATNVSLFHAANKPLLDWFGLKDAAAGAAFRAQIEDMMVAALADEFGKYFHGQESGVLVAPNPTAQFNDYAALNSWSPDANNNQWNDMSLADLEAMYAKASLYYGYLKNIETYENLGIWQLVLARCAVVAPPEKPFTMNTTAQKNWLDNLQRFINNWKLYEIRDWTVELLKATEFDLHIGANKNTWGGTPPPGWVPVPDYVYNGEDRPYNPEWPADPSDPEPPDIGSGVGNPEDIYGNSYFRVGNTLLRSYTETAQAYKKVLDDLYGDPAYTAQIDFVFCKGAGEYFGGYNNIYQGGLTKRLAALEKEALYRYNNGDGDEETWYTYRSFFLPLYVANLSGQSTSQLMTTFNKVMDEKAKYNAALAQANSVLGNELAEEIFGGHFKDNVIDYVVDRLYNYLAAQLTMEVFEAMKMILGMEQGGAIQIKPGGYDINVLDWTTFAVLENIIGSFNVGDPKMDVYQLLLHGREDNADRTGKLGDDSLDLPGRSPGYTSSEVKTDYNFLLNAVLSAINSFKQDPAKYFKQTKLNPPARNVNPNGLLDILRGHQYADVGVGPGRQAAYWAAPGSYTHTPQQYYGNSSGTNYNGNDSIDDGAMNALIERLDNVLGGGNIGPLLGMLGASDALSGLGLKISGDTNLQTIIESLMGNVLFTDSMVNSIYGMIYPMLLTMIEEMLGSELPGMVKPALHDTAVLFWRADQVVNLAVHHLAYILNGTGGNTFGLLPLYPHLMGERMAATTIFPEVRQKLRGATWGKQYQGYWIDLNGGMSITTPVSGSPINNYKIDTNGDGVIDAADNQRRFYPTHSWEQPNSPGLYAQKVDEDGKRIYESDGVTPMYEFSLPWYIEHYRPGESFALPATLPAGTGYSPGEVVGYGRPNCPDNERITYCGHSSTSTCGLCKRGRWEAAMAEMMKGLFPVLNAALLGNNTTIKHDDPIAAQILVDFGGSGVAGHLQLSVGGLNLFAQILNPIFEMLLGEDAYGILKDSGILRSIGTAAAGSSSNDAGYLAQYNAARGLVSALLDPLYQYIEKLSKKPVTKILDLLPNLFYALSFDRIKPLLQNLKIDLTYKAWVKILADIPVMNDTVGLELTKGLNAADDSLVGPMLVPLLNDTLSLNSLLDMIFGMLGDDMPIPYPNTGAFMSYGQMMSSTYALYGTSFIGTKRSRPPSIPLPPGTPAGVTAVRHYIKADRPDMMQGLLKYIFGAVPGLLDGLMGDLNLPILAGTPDEQVAAIAELVMPRKYDVTQVTYGTPVKAESPYPPWWAGLHPGGEGKAKLDGDYLVDNADALISILWEMLTGKSFSDGVRELMAPMFGGELMASVVAMIQDMIVNLLTSGALGDFDMLNMVEMLVRIGGQKLDLQKFFDRPLGTVNTTTTPTAPVPPNPPAALGGSPSAREKNNYIAALSTYTTALSNYKSGLNTYKSSVAAGSLKSRPLPPVKPTKPEPPVAPTLPKDPTPEQTEAYNDYRARWIAANAAYPSALAAYEDTLAAYEDALAAYEDALAGYKDDVVNYYAANINGVDDFFDSLIYFLDPINQILGILLNGDDLELVNLSNDSSSTYFNKGLLKILGDNGAVNGLAHIIKMITRPLEDIGLVYTITSWAKPMAAGDSWYDDTPTNPHKVAAAELAEAQARWARIQTPLGQTLFPLVDALNMLIDKPVASLLSVLPNLAYFITKPQEGRDNKPGDPGYLDSPLQQALDNLLHPLYVLLDTLRPIVDVHEVLGSLVPSLDLNNIYAGVTFRRGETVRIDVEALLASLLGDGIELGGMQINLDLTQFLQGVKHATDNYLVADKAGVLFTLMDQLGLLDMIFDMGMVGVTKLIQYGKAPEPDRINYGVAPKESSLAPAQSAAEPNGVPTWFKQSHAQYLVDNVDLVLKWAWNSLINEPSTNIKPVLQGILDGFLDGVTVGNSLQATVDTIWNNQTYVKDNLQMLVDIVLDLETTLNALDLRKELGLDTLDLSGLGLDLPPDLLGSGPLLVKDLLKRLIFVYDPDKNYEALPASGIPVDTTNPMPLDLDYIFAPFHTAAATLASVTNQATFETALKKLFGRIMPVLNVFLGDTNILLIYHPDITNPTDPDMDPWVQKSGGAMDQSFLRAYGYKGYETGLLPILMGIGADIPGFVDSLEEYGTYKAASSEDQLLMIFKPIFNLLGALSNNPVQTLFQVLPNVVYFVSDDTTPRGEKSLFLQALDNILYPLTSLLGMLGTPTDLASMPVPPAPYDVLADVLAGREPRPAKYYGEEPLRTDYPAGAEYDAVFDAAHDKWTRYKFYQDFLNWMKTDADGIAYEAKLEKWNFSQGPLFEIAGLLNGLLGDLKIGDMLNDMLVGPDGFLKDFLPAGFTIEELIVGQIISFSDMPGATALMMPHLNYLDTLGLQPLGAKYVDVNLAELLKKLLYIAGVFPMIEDFQGLINMLNVHDRDVNKTPSLIDYGQAPITADVDVDAIPWLNDGKDATGPFAGGSRNEQVAQFLADNVDGILNWLWREFVYDEADINTFVATELGGMLNTTVTVEDTYAKTVQGILGSFLYTQENLDMIVGMLYTGAGDGLLETLMDLSFPIDVNGATITLNLKKLLPKLVMLGDDPLVIEDMFDNLMAYDPVNPLGPHYADYKVVDTTPAAAKASFLHAVYYMLGPVMPLLRVFLAGNDIKLISMDVIQGYPTSDDPNIDPAQLGKGFLVIDGYNGYRTGLLPLLMAIGADVPDYLDELMDPAEFEKDTSLGGPTDEQRLEAIVDPLLWLVNRLAENPVKTLLQVLPNLLYFIVPGWGADKKSQLDGDPNNDINADPDDDRSLISQALANILYPVTSLVGNLLPMLDKLAPDLLDGILPAAPIDLGFGGLTLSLSLDDLKDLGGLIDGLLVQVMGKTLGDLGMDASSLGTLSAASIGELLKLLIVGEKTLFFDKGYTDLAVVGIDTIEDYPSIADKASYVDVNEGQLIIQILNVVIASGLLDDVLTGDITDIIPIIIGLLNIDGPPGASYGPELIDYSKAPAPTAVVYDGLDEDGNPIPTTMPSGLDDPDRTWLFKYADFLLDNIDDVLNWAWAELVYGMDHYDDTGNPTNTYPLQGYVQDLLNDLLGMGAANGAPDVKLEANLQDTLKGIFGDVLYTTDNLQTVANMLVGPGGFLNDLDIVLLPDIAPSLTLFDILKKAAGVEDRDGNYDALDVAKILADIATAAGFLPAPGSSISKTQFVTYLSNLLAPIEPLLRVFLAESDLLIIKDPDVNHDDGLIRLYGTNGYETGLLPLLMALGAGLDDPTARANYQASLKTYDEILLPGGLVAAILDPLLTLLESLVDQPVTTLLGILPNLLYFILPGADGQSLLSQALVNILYPVTEKLPALWPLIKGMLGDVKLGDIDLTDLDFDDLEGLGIGLNSVLTGLVGGLDIGLTLPDGLLPLLYSLLCGKVMDFDGSYAGSKGLVTGGLFSLLGRPTAQYLEVDKKLLLVSVIDAVLDMGLLDEYGGEETLEALLKLLNINKKPPKGYGPGWIDYAKAPAVNTAANVDPNLRFLLDEGYAQFLLDNVDGIVQWAWDELIIANPAFKAALEDMLSGLGIPITLNPAGLSATINDLLGDVLFIPDNLALVAGMIGTPLAELTKIAVLTDDTGKTTLSLLDILGVVGEMNDHGAGTSLKDVLVSVINSFTTYTPPATISGADDFKDELVNMLAPLAPVLRLLLMEGNDLVLIQDANVNDGEGLIRIFGANGYETGLLPLLMGIGGSIDGFLATLKPLSAITSDEKLIEAILDPILFLLQKLADDPLNTLLQMLPNVAYFVLPGPNGESLLSQALENIIYPIGELLKALPPSLLGSLGLDLGDFDLTNLGKSLNNMLMGMLNGIDLGNGVGLVDLLRKLVVADNVVFPPDFAKYGVYGSQANGARYLKVNLPLLLVQIIDAVLDMTGADTSELGPTLHDILSLLNYNQVPREPEKLDYNYAGWEAADDNNKKVEDLYDKYDWLKPEHTDFLVDNVDRVVDWAWAALFTDKGGTANQGGRDWLQDLLGGLLGVDVKVEDTLQGTLEGLLGNLLYTKSNLDLIVNMVLGLKDSVDIEIMTGLTLNDVIKAAVVIGDQPLDLNQLFQPFVNYKNKQLPANLTEEQFKGTLKDLLTPLVPLLRVFLTDSDLLGIVHPNVNGGQGLIKIAGVNGYENGLLPILMALGADLFDENGNNGYLKTLKTYTQVLSSDGALLDAILDPLLYLLNALVQDPVHTLLRVLPNVAYFIIDPVIGYDAKGKPIYGDSMLQQALNNILIPLAPILKLDLIKGLLPEGFDLTKLLLGNMIDGLLSDIGLSLKDLIVGEVKRFDSAYLRSLGVNGSLANQASYLHVNMGGLLVNLLELLGVLQMLDETGFAGLINLLNTPGRMPHGPPHRVHYPQVETADLKAVYDCVFWTRKDALALVGKLPALVDDIFELIFGKRLGSVPLEADASASGYLRDMLGDALYTQDNFKSIVAMVQDLLAGLDLNMAIIPGKTEDDPPNRTLGHLLDNAVQIGDTQLNLLDVIDQLKDWVPSGSVDGQRNFINELLDFLKPVAPVLDFLLFGEDLVVLPIEVKPDSGSKAKGLVYAEGYEGYKYGLIPLYEALLKPLGAQGEIRDAGWFEGKSNRQKLEGILHPILYAVEQLVTDPLKNLLAMLPNLVYFIFDRNVIEDCSKVNTPLEDSLDNILYAVTSVLGTMTNTGNGGSAALFAMLGIDFNVPVLLTDLLNGLLGDMNIPIDVGELLEQLHVGTLTTYPSKSGDDKAKYLSLEADQDRADLLTVVLKWLLGRVQDENNGDLRESIISMLVNLIMTEGAFGSRALHWGLHYVLWVLRLGGTDITLKQFLNLVKFLSFLMPVVRWIGKMFGLF